MNYTDIAAVEAYTLTDIQDSFEPQVEEWIEAVSRMFDMMAGRTLVAGEEDTVRYFNGNNLGHIAIDDAIEITEVAVGDEYGSNFVANASSFPYPKSVPFRKLALSSGSFDRGIQNVRVTARWGMMEEVPADLKFAATVVVAGIINGQNPDAKAVKSEAIGNFKVTYADDTRAGDYDRAIAIVERYKRHAL